MKVSYSSSTRAALVVAAGAVGLFFLWRSRGEAPSIPHAAGTSAPATAAAAPQGAAGALPAGPQLADEASADEYEDNPIGDILHRILANDRQLDAFMYYHHRPLLDPAAIVKFHELLSDQATFAAVKHDLLYPEETKVDQAGNIKRLMKIDYLRDALEWKENPRRDELIGLVSEIILTDNYPAGMGMDMRLSLSGNKMELYALLSEIAPDRASAALQAAKGTRLEAMVAYIASSIQERKQLEARLETEVKP